MERVDIKQVRSNPDNPRFIKGNKFDKLVKSIKEFPQMLDLRPIVVNQDMIVLGGNMRLKACEEAGLKEVPIIFADNLTPEQEKEFIIKDNSSFGEWDWDLLANEWNTDQLIDWGLDIPDDWAVDEVLEAEEDDFEAGDDIQTDIVLGDLIEIGEHRLLCGDSTDSDQVAKLMNAEKADMVFTDPPYGVSYEGGHNKKKRDGIIADTLSGSDLSTLFEDSINTACIFTHDYPPFYIWYSTNKSIETFTGLSNTPISVRAVIAWYKVKSGLDFWFRYAISQHDEPINNLQPNYFIGSGLNEIEGNIKRTFTLQVRYKIK